MQILKKKTNKKLIPELPISQFQGRIITISTPGEVEMAVNYLLKFPVLGLDTETRPQFGKGGKRNKVALLQVSTYDTCFLFRLNLIGFPLALCRLLEDERIPKIGLSLHDDFMAMHARSKFTPRNYVELQKLIKEFGVEDQSLAKIYANLFHERISKAQQLSNWEAEILTDKQKIYAATDAWACIRIYEHLEYLRSTHDYIVEDDEENLSEEGQG